MTDTPAPQDIDSLSEADGGITLTVRMDADGWDTTLELLSKTTGPAYEINVQGRGKSATALYRYKSAGPDTVRIMAPEGRGEMSLKPDTESAEALQFAELLAQAEWTFGIELQTTLTVVDDGVTADYDGKQLLRFTTPGWSEQVQPGTTREGLLQQIREARQAHETPAPDDNSYLSEITSLPLLRVPTLSIVQPIRRGLQDGTPWKQSDKGATYQEPKARVYLEMRTAEMIPIFKSVFDEASDPKDAMAKVLGTMNDLDADIFDMLTAAALLREKPMTEPTIVYLEQVFAARGRTVHTGYYEKDAKAYADKIMRLCNTYIKGTGRHKKSGRYIETEYNALLFVLRGHGPPLQPSLGTEGEIGYISYSLGDWAKELESPAGKQYFGYMLTLTLQMDPYRQQVEKRLLRYLTWQWRCHAQDRVYSRPLTVQSILEGAGLMTDCDNAEQTRHGQSWRTRFDKALNFLEDEGAISSWYYRAGDDKVTDSEDLALPRKGAMSVWKRYCLVIEPPANIPMLYDRLALQGQIHAGQTLKALERKRRKK